MKRPLVATQAGLSGAGFVDVSVGIPAVVTYGPQTAMHRPVQFTVRGIESVRNLGWSVGMTLASNPGLVATNKQAADSLRQLADDIEHGPRDNLGVKIRTELRDNLDAEGIHLDSIWQVR